MAYSDGVNGSSWCDRPARPGYAALERIAVASPRFAACQPEAGVFALHEPFQTQEVISCLILGKKRALLFDTGMGLASFRPVAEELTPFDGFSFLMRPLGPPGAAVLRPA